MTFLEGLLGYKGRVTIGIVELDASISELHTLEASVTSHPVEAGSNISDNYRMNPIPVQIEGRITNTPLAVKYPGQSLVNSVKNAKAGSDFVQDAWSNIVRYFMHAETVVVTTSLQEYYGVVLERFSVTRDSKNGQNLNFTCVARQMRKVRAKSTTAIEEPKKPKTKAVEKSKSQGKKPTKDAKPERQKSIAAKGLDSGKEFFSGLLK